MGRSFIAGKGRRGKPIRIISALRSRKVQSRVCDVVGRERGDALKILGYNSYSEYLRSDLWKEIRIKVLERDNYVCKSCDGTATQVHHSQYNLDTLSGKELRYLHSCCNSCHAKKGHVRGEPKVPQNSKICGKCHLPIEEKKWKMSICRNCNKKNIAERRTAKWRRTMGIQKGV